MSVCVFGDSVAKGVVYDEIKNKYVFLENSFANLFAKHRNTQVKNLAKFGCTVRKGVELVYKYEDELKTFDQVALEFGGNDCNFNWKEISEDPSAHHEPMVGRTEFVRDYETIVRKVKAAGCMPVMLSMPPIDADLFFDWVSRGLSREKILRFLREKEFIYRWHELYNISVFEIARKEHVPFIDIRKVFLQERKITDLLCIDGMHPNEKGHALISRAILGGEPAYF